MESISDNLKKLRKKLQEEIEDSLDVNEDSDIPVSLKKVKDKKFREI